MSPDQLSDALDAHRRWVEGEPDGRRAKLTDTKLTDATLVDANLTNANLTNANLADANLARANLADANLARATLARANLAYANLAHADLADADLTGANLTGANLARSNLADADLTGARLVDANLVGAVLPEGWRVDQIGAHGPRRRTLTVMVGPDMDQPWVQQGCISGTPEEFRDLFAGRLGPWQEEMGAEVGAAEHDRVLRRLDEALEHLGAT